MTLRDSPLAKRLVCFGLGYSARHLVARLDRTIWSIAGTVRDAEAAQKLKSDGIDAFVFDGSGRATGIDAAIANATHVLISAPPDAAGDPVLAQYADDLAHARSLTWLGYLSTVGVYGDHDGRWVDEATPVAPVSERSRFRVAAETQWLDFAHASGKRVVIFRLAGIYGPRRSAIDSVRSGRARRIVKPGQRFNRIHVEDIARAVEASMAGRGRATILNVADDEPAPPQDVITYAARLLNAPMPPEIQFADADLTPMARTFYGENKQVRNDLMKQDLGLTLAFPTYREGLAQLASLQPTR